MLPFKKMFRFNNKAPNRAFIFFKRDLKMFCFLKTNRNIAIVKLWAQLNHTSLLQKKTG